MAYNFPETENKILKLSIAANNNTTINNTTTNTNSNNGNNTTIDITLTTKTTGNCSFIVMYDANGNTLNAYLTNNIPYSSYTFVG